MLRLLHRSFVAALATATLCSFGTATDFDCNVLFCTQEYNPVCGTDGNTYPTLCDLTVKACNQPHTVNQLDVKYQGACK